MTRTLVNRRAAAILSAALTLGVAGPAVAQPIDAAGPYSPYTAVPIPQQQPVATPSGGNSDLDGVLIGAGAVAVLISGAAVATQRRRHARVTARPTIAA